MTDKPVVGEAVTGNAKLFARIAELEAENKRQADWMGEARELLTKAWFPIKPLDDRRDALLEGDTGIPASEGE